MEFVFLLLHGSEWEDITILLSREDAIHASKKYPEARVEIFGKSDTMGYTPTYNYYKNGTLSVKHNNFQT